MNRSLCKLILWGILFSVFGAEPSFAEPRVRRNVEIEFETIEGASLYEVQLRRKDDKNGKWMRLKAPTPQWSTNVKPGMYLMQTRAYDDRGAPGDWSPVADLKVRLPAIIVNSPGPNEVIKAKAQDSATVKFAWEPIPGARGYRLTFKNADGKISTERNVSESQWSGKIMVGHAFTWNAVAIDDNGEDGEVSAEPYAFQLLGPPLEKPSIDRPYSKHVQEMTWSKSPYAERYSYALSRYNAKTKAWEQVEKVDSLTETKAVLDISQRSGRYRMAVTAHAVNRADSTPGQIEFYMEGGFKNQEEFDKAMLRDAITKPTKYYAIANYLFTKINYSGTNTDTDSTPTFKANGGTGRVGFGYQPPKRPWGGFGIVDLSGFIIRGSNYRFASAELHATRKLEFGHGGLLLFATGLFSKELPIVSGTVQAGWNDLGKVRSNGVHGGFTFWQPLKGRYGLQANARAYYTLMGSANGQDVDPGLSYQYGLLASYRLDKSTTGYAGYVYRKDQAVFQKNSITIDGNYINFIMEFRF